MNQFEQLKMLYTQFFNLAEEIKTLVESEDYNEALSKVNYKETLLKKLLLARNSVELTEDEKAQIKVIEQNLSEKELENINLLRTLQNRVKEELQITNKKIKIKNAYAQEQPTSGSILNFSE